MQPSNAYLYRLWGESLAVCYRAAPGYEARLTPHASLAFSGEPVADLNYAILDAGPRCEALLREFIEAGKGRGLPVLFLLTPEALPRLGPLLRDAGLHQEGRVPSMIYRPGDIRFEEASFDIVRVEDQADLEAANSLVSQAFNVPVDSLNRTFGPAFLDGPGVDYFLGRQDGKAVSTVQTTRAGPMVGLWCMATAPDQQRQGAGRGLLNHVMAYHRRRGADLFYLGATAAGKPLYERIGFRTVSEVEVWLLPAGS